MIDLSVYLVTDAALCGERGVVSVVREAVDGGVTAVQLRDKQATADELLRMLDELAVAIDGRAALLVNDALDVAVMARDRGIPVDGVHLGQGDESVRIARERLGPDAVIGLTANTAAHLAAVDALPLGTVDHLGVGVIRPTTTKTDHPTPLGIDGFGAFARRSALPCVAIGGVRLDDVIALRDAGAAGVAVVSAICAAPHPRAAAHRFRRRWSSPQRTAVPRVLSIAGSDSSGGAGIQADLKSIAANGGYGATAITALTAQNTRGVSGIHVPPAAFLRAQLDAVMDDIKIDAVKIGMLANAEIAIAVRTWIDDALPPLVVLDPVMISTSGDRLLDEDAEAAIEALLPYADLITPNLPELAALTGTAVAGDWEAALEQASELSRRTGVAVLAKGGHLDGDDAPDALVDGTASTVFRGARIATTSTHGTGCSLSSALATRLVTSSTTAAAVAKSRAWLRESLEAGDALDVGHGHGPISHFAGLWSRGGVDLQPTATAITDAWWAEIADLRADIDGLPFIRGLAAGTLARDPFLTYLAQDALYLRDYARVLAEAAKLAPTAAEQAFWASSAHGAIVGELELHASWISPATGVGADTFAAEPLPATTAYLDHLLATAQRGDYAVLAAALLPCFWLYTDLGVRLQRGDFGASALDAAHPYASWLATYADASFAAATARAIDIVGTAAAAATASTRDRMRRAFRIASEHERAFFAAPLA